MSGGSSTQAALDWWRRATFMLAAALIAAIGYWLIRLDDRVQENTQGLTNLSRGVQELRVAVENNTEATLRHYEKLEELAAFVEETERRR